MPSDGNICSSKRHFGSGELRRHYHQKKNQCKFTIFENIIIAAYKFNLRVRSCISDEYFDVCYEVTSHHSLTDFYQDEKDYKM